MVAFNNLDPKVTCAVSDRSWGNMALIGRNDDETRANRLNRERFIDRYAPFARETVTPKLGDSVDIALLPSQVDTLVEADILISTTPGQILAFPLGDCFGAMLYQPKGPFVALVHVGRHGLIKGIIPKALYFLETKLGAAAEDLILVLSPAMMGEYSIYQAYGLWMASEMLDGYVEKLPENRGFRVCWAACAIDQFADHGILPAHFHGGLQDTAAPDSKYFSHHRWCMRKQSEPAFDEPDGRHLMIAGLTP